MEAKEARNKIVECFAAEGQTSYKVLIEIQGRFLVDNNLVEAWALSRNKSVKEVSAPGFTDNITLLQAQLLGVLDFVKNSD